MMKSYRNRTLLWRIISSANIVALFIGVWFVFPFKYAAFVFGLLLLFSLAVGELIWTIQEVHQDK